MATTSPQLADGLQTPPPGSRAQLAAAFYPACPNNKPGRFQSEIKAVDCAREPAEHEISFGRFRLLPAQRLLLEGDKPVLIGGRAFDLLTVYVTRINVLAFAFRRCCHAVNLEIVLLLTS
jgi:hypothetical protein